MEMDPESADAIARLDRYRLERDLTFEDLAAEMTAAGFSMKTRTLHLALRGRCVARDRTRFKIRAFIDTKQTAAERTA